MSADTAPCWHPAAGLSEDYGINPSQGRSNPEFIEHGAYTKVGQHSLTRTAALCACCCMAPSACTRCTLLARPAEIPTRARDSVPACWQHTWRATAWSAEQAAQVAAQQAAASTAASAAQQLEALAREPAAVHMPAPWLAHLPTYSLHCCSCPCCLYQSTAATGGWCPSTASQPPSALASCCTATAWCSRCARRG